MPARVAESGVGALGAERSDPGNAEPEPPRIPGSAAETRRAYTWGRRRTGWHFVRRGQHRASGSEARLQGRPRPRQQRSRGDRRSRQCMWNKREAQISRSAVSPPPGKHQGPRTLARGGRGSAARPLGAPVGQTCTAAGRGHPKPAPSSGSLGRSKVAGEKKDSPAQATRVGQDRAVDLGDPGPQLGSIEACGTGTGVADDHLDLTGGCSPVDRTTTKSARRADKWRHDEVDEARPETSTPIPGRQAGGQQPHSTGGGGGEQVTGRDSTNHRSDRTVVRVRPAMGDPGPGGRLPCRWRIRRRRLHPRGQCRPMRGSEGGIGSMGPKTLTFGHVAAQSPGSPERS